MLQSSSLTPSVAPIHHLCRRAGASTSWTRRGSTRATVEDFERFGTFARDKEIGLSEPPTDLYYRGAYMAMYKMNLLNNPLIPACYACLQDEIIHFQEFQVIEDYLNTYKDVPNLMYVHLGQYSHNDVNMAKLYDDGALRYSARCSFLLCVWC